MLSCFKNLFLPTITGKGKHQVRANFASAEKKKKNEEKKITNWALTTKTSWSCTLQSIGGANLLTPEFAQTWRKSKLEWVSFVSLTFLSLKHFRADSWIVLWTCAPWFCWILYNVLYYKFSCVVHFMLQCNFHCLILFLVRRTTLWPPAIVIQLTVFCFFLYTIL